MCSRYESRKDNDNFEKENKYEMPNRVKRVLMSRFKLSFKSGWCFESQIGFRQEWGEKMLN